MVVYINSISFGGRRRAFPPYGSSALDVRKLLRRLLALEHPVIAHHRRDAQPVVGNNAAAALELRLMMFFVLPPFNDCRFVAPERQRQNPAGLGQAGETLDRNEAVDFF